MSSSAVRLYVGGLADSVTADELAQRFRSFGTVSHCEVARVKANDTVLPATCSCRGFGHLSLDPKDAAAMRKCLQVYNGSKWRGKTLKVHVAKPHFLEKLKEEREDAKKSLKEAFNEAEKERDNRSKAIILTLTLPNGEDFVTANNGQKRNFEETLGRSVSELEWGGLPPTPAIKRRITFEQEASEAWAAKLAERAAKNPAEEQKGSLSESSVEFGTIDFVGDDERFNKHALDLDRFSEGGSYESAQPSDALNDEAVSKTAADPAADKEAAALWSEQGGLDSYLAALEAPTMSISTSDTDSESIADDQSSSTSTDEVSENGDVAPIQLAPSALEELPGSGNLTLNSQNSPAQPSEDSSALESEYSDNTTSSEEKSEDSISSAEAERPEEELQKEASRSAEQEDCAQGHVESGAVVVPESWPEKAKDAKNAAQEAAIESEDAVSGDPSAHEIDMQDIFSGKAFKAVKKLVKKVN